MNALPSRIHYQIAELLLFNLDKLFPEMFRICAEVDVDLVSLVQDLHESWWQYLDGADACRR